MAIAFDSGTYAQYTNGTSLTFSHTCTGSDRILFVMGHDKSNSATIITGITYGGVAMTQVNTLNGGAGQNDRAITLWYLIAPATGSNNVVVSASESDNLRFSAVSYTGASQTGQPEGTDTSTGNSVTTISTDITTTVNNCWMLMFSKDGAGNITYTNTTGDTIRLNTDAGGHVIVDTNEAIADVGTNTITNTMSSTTLGALAVTFRPALTKEEIEHCVDDDTVALWHCNGALEETLISDDFNRADSASVGGDWTDGAETVKIDTNRLFVGAVGGSQAPIVYQDHGTLSGSTSLHFTIIPSSGTARQGYAGYYADETVATGSLIGIRWQMGTNGSNNSLVTHGGVSVDTFSANFTTTQYVWIDCIPASSTTVDINVYVSTSSTKPSSVTASTTGVTVPTDTNIRFSGDSIGSGDEYYIDNVYLYDISKRDDSSSNYLSLTEVNTPTAATGFDGEANGAYQLTASSSEYLSVADNAALDITGDMTIEAWVYADSTPSTNQRGIVAKWAGSNEAYRFLNKDIGGSTAGLAFRVDTSGGEGEASWAYSLSASQWYYLAVTYDQSTGTATLYVDGVSQGTSSTSQTGAINSTGADLKIGLDDSAGSGYWDGRIDEVKISTRIKSAEEIAKYYSGTVSAKYWSTDDSYIESVNTANNYGGLALVNIYHSVSSEVDALFKFAGVTNLPSSDINITIGEFNGYYYNGVSELTYNRITSDWAEGTVTWANFSSAYTGTGNVTETVSSGSGFKQIDISSIITNWADGTWDNYGFLVHKPAEDVTGTNIHTKEETPAQTKDPYLWVEYTASSSTDYTETYTTIITVTPSHSRLLEIYRTISTTITLAGNKIIGKAKTLLATLTLSVQQSNIIGFFKSYATTITLTPSYNRLLEIYRTISTAITLAGNKTIGRVKTLLASLTLSSALGVLQDVVAIVPKIISFIEDKKPKITKFIKDKKPKIFK